VGVVVGVNVGVNVGVVVGVLVDATSGPSMKTPKSLSS
jgi:hypothetical protein